MNDLKPHTNSALLKKGFTLVELLVSIAIFVLITGLVLVKYSSFDGGILLTNLAYDVALTIREAQASALNVRETDLGSANFVAPYGAHFESSDTDGANTVFYLYADQYPATKKPPGDNMFENTPSGDAVITKYQIKRGNKVKKLCAGTSKDACTEVSSLDVVFLRPNPDARIAVNGNTGYTYARITLSAPDDATKDIVVQVSGQISIE